MFRFALVASILALASAAQAGTEIHQPAMRVLPNDSNLVFVGEAGGFGGKVDGYYIDPTTIQRSGNEVSIEATQYSSTEVAMGGHQVRFVQMRFFFDCSQMTLKFGKFVAMDSNGTVVDRQDGVSQAGPMQQNTIQYLIRQKVCR